MFVDRSREKLLQAIVFFCKNTKHCHTLKLFKLLNLLDQEHFRQTGRTVTGLKYFALPMGPVPTALFDELSRPSPDLSRTVSIVARKDADLNRVERRDIRPKIQFDPSVFTKREIRILNRLSMLFDTAHGDDMSELSHMHGLPWSKVWGNGSGSGKVIPEELSLAVEPLISDVQTIDSSELAYRKELLRDRA